MAMVHLVRKNGKYVPGHCVRPGCRGSYRFGSSSREYRCTRCGFVIQAVPAATNASNVDDLRWDGSKWFFLKQKKTS